MLEQYVVVQRTGFKAFPLPVIVAICLEIWMFLNKCTNMMHSIVNKISTRKGGICNALQLEDRMTAGQSFWAVFGQSCTTYAQKLLPASFRSKFWHRHWIWPA